MRPLIIDLPKSMYTVLPERKIPTRFVVAKTMLAIVGISVLFAVGVAL